MRFASGVIAIAGAVLVALGCALPFATSGSVELRISRTTTPHAILFYALEPIGVILAAAILGVLLLIRPPFRLTPGMLLGIWRSIDAFLRRFHRLLRQVGLWDTGPVRRMDRSFRGPRRSFQPDRSYWRLDSGPGSALDRPRPDLNPTHGGRDQRARPKRTWRYSKHRSRHDPARPLAGAPNRPDPDFTMPPPRANGPAVDGPTNVGRVLRSMSIEPPARRCLLSQLRATVVSMERRPRLQPAGRLRHQPSIPRRPHTGRRRHHMGHQLRTHSRATDIPRQPRHNAPTDSLSRGWCSESSGCTRSGRFLRWYLGTSPRVKSTTRTALKVAEGWQSRQSCSGGSESAS